MSEHCGKKRHYLSRAISGLSHNVFNNYVFQDKILFSRVLNLAALKSNMPSDWPHDMVKPIRSYVTVKFTKSWRKRPKMFLRMVGE